MSLETVDLEQLLQYGAKALISEKHSTLLWDIAKSQDSKEQFSTSDVNSCPCETLKSRKQARVAFWLSKDMTATLSG